MRRDLLVISLLGALVLPGVAQPGRGLDALSFLPESQARADRSYERGQEALRESRWDNALEIFSAIPKDSPRGDAALYWKAYSLNKLGRRPEALAVIADLQKSFPDSRWANDARALEVEIRQAGGQPVPPDAESNDDLKLLAINSLMNTDPERAVPLLEKILQGTASPKLKERALFVLIQSGSPRAREVVAQFARGGANPDLQLKAIDQLGLFGGKASRQTLADIYAASNDTRVKRRILRAFMLGGDRDRLLAAAKQEKSPELRAEAVRQLGLVGGVEQLAELYQAETTTEGKKAIIHSLFLAGAADRIGQLARSEKDTGARLDAIRSLGLMGKKTGPDLVAMYASDPDKAVKKAVLQALFLQGNATAIVEIARKETDPELKKEAVQKLSLMNSKEAAEFMMEVLNK
jgi:HEAT repeat protein